ncbi:hypothetical protein GGF31_006147 [Allomyces arbusculus]|nr:hypothetical protein GGF31_006147 [Allomyces arbusculus]
MANLAKLFNKAEWAKYVAALPGLANWADVKSMAMAPIMAATADSLNLPGNQLRFAMVTHAHQDLTSCPWAMDMAGMGAVHHFHTEALVQYPKFLAMAVAHPSMSLVSTSAIDLSWHRQLAPLAYGKHTLALMGHGLDDVVSEARIADGVKETEALWMREFGEGYFQSHVKCALGAKYQATETLFFGGVSPHDNHASCVAEASTSPKQAHVSGFCYWCYYDGGGAGRAGEQHASGTGSKQVLS